MSDVSIEQLAALLNLSSTAVTSHARRGILVRSVAKGKRGKFVLELSVRRYCQHLREQASGDLVAWRLCEACLDVEAASIMLFE